MISVVLVMVFNLWGISVFMCILGLMISVLVIIGRCADMSL